MIRPARARHILRLRVAGALVLACASAASAATTGAPVDEARAQMVGSLHNNVAPAFVLDKELPLDPALRAAADRIGAEHLARLDKLFPAWLDEERSRQSTAGKAPEASALFFAVFARLANEMALWQIEPGDADYENATLEVLRSAPRLCDLKGDYRFTDFASRILRIQAMPTQQRDAALATERRLLAHWGQPRAVVTPWPEPLPQDAALALLLRGPTDAALPRLALPPRTAAVTLGMRLDYADMHPTERCGVQQWWLQQSLRQGAAPADVLNAFRYGTMLGAVERIGTAFDKPGAQPKPGLDDRPPYPSIASRFVVTGATVVEVQVDANGKPQHASVVARTIEVQGIRGVRPVAFENVFDKAAVAYAMLDGRRYPKPADNAPFRFQLAWTLEDHEPSAGAPAQKGSKP